MSQKAGEKWPVCRYILHLKILCSKNPVKCWFGKYSYLQLTWRRYKNLGTKITLLWLFRQNAELAKLRQECSKLTKELSEKSETLQQEEQQKKSLEVKAAAFEKQIDQLQVSNAPINCSLLPSLLLKELLLFEKKIALTATIALTIFLAVWALGWISGDLPLAQYPCANLNHPVIIPCFLSSSVNSWITRPR